MAMDSGFSPIKKINDDKIVDNGGIGSSPGVSGLLKSLSGGSVVNTVQTADGGKIDDEKKKKTRR